MPEGSEGRLETTPPRAQTASGPTGAASRAAGMSERSRRDQTPTDPAAGMSERSRRDQTPSEPAAGMSERSRRNPTSADQVASSSSSSVVHTTAEIARLIPHRWPFLLVDRIVEYDPGARRIVGEKAVTATEWFFHGHFPDLPVMPGVLQVEALAQTMAVYVAKQPGFGDAMGLFAGIDECRFKRIVTPGDVLRLEVTMEKLGRRFGRGRGVASVSGDVACEALLSFIIPPPGTLR